MFASNDTQLVLRDANRQIKLIQSDDYRKAFPEFEPGEQVKAAGHFENASGGRRFSTTPGGRGVGWHADTQVVDDPNKPRDARNPLALGKVEQWWAETMASRRAHAATFARVIIMQRIAERDLAGVALEQGYEHLMIPMWFEPNASWDRGSSLDWRDPRSEPGELAWPERFSEETVEEIKSELGSPANVAAQLQQNPTPDSGGILEKGWLQHTWTDPLPKALRIVQSWDFGFKGSDAAHSRVSGALWGEHDGWFYLLDRVLGVWNYPESKRQFISAQSRELRVKRHQITAPIKWADANVVLIEAKANGSAVIAEIDEGLPGVKVPKVKAVNPTDDKATRLIAHSDRFEAGRVLLPPTHEAPWVEEYRHELVAFPRGAHDDEVDTTTQALDHLVSAHTRYMTALQGLSA
jgi:predicted phage terminase large subunit-like protein